jgi:MoxR-like ATPase
MRATRATPMILLGAGPRAGVHLMVASRWIAALDGRTFVTPDDVQRALHPVVCHRLVLAPEVELDGLGPDEVIDRVSATVEVPR